MERKIMTWDGIVFGAICFTIGYGLGSALTKADMRAARSDERERESDALKEERKTWIDHGRAIELQIREASENSN